MPESEAFKESELDEQFNEISSTIEEALKLKSDGKISDAEFAEKLEASKMELDSVIAKSRVSLETKQILRARAASLFPPLPKRAKRKQKSPAA
jgi:hypothetical protein